jgi:hypothetical protein
LSRAGNIKTIAGRAFCATIAASFVSEIGQQQAQPASLFIASRKSRAKAIASKK